jgi:cellobiose phosphorylase
MNTIAPGPYGHFDAQAREYVITRPDTPRPWFNYLMNDSYVAMISNTGGGVSYDTDPRVFRGVTYRITVRNPDGVSKGVRALRVDGKPVRGTVIPHRPGTRDVKADVLMGP